MAKKAEKKPAPKEKGEVKKKASSKKWKCYESGKRKNKFCPKCGLGVFLSQHKNRVTCGQCSYTEFK